MHILKQKRITIELEDCLVIGQVQNFVELGLNSTKISQYTIMHACMKLTQISQYIFILYRHFTAQKTQIPSCQASISLYVLI